MDASELLELLEALVRPVGFGNIQEIRALVQEQETRHYICSSPYATILLLITATQEKEALAREIDAAQEQLDNLLVGEERRKQAVVDGYLLVCLEMPPSPDLMNAVVREYELNTHLCRKLIFWPEDADTVQQQWRRLLKLTVLALPKTSESDTQIVWPEFDQHQQEIWRLISRSGSPAAAAKKFLRES